MRRPWPLVAAALLAALIVVGIVLSRRSGPAKKGSTAGAHQDHGGSAVHGGSAEEGGLAWLGEANRPRRTIAGRVTLDGAPHAGATVRLESAATDAGAFAPPEIVTAADGAFDFGERAAGTWVVVAEAPGTTGDLALLDLRDPDGKPRPDRVELVLTACTASLFGTVKDASGGTIARARVAVQSGPAVLSDDDGSYELCVPPGRIALLAGADGYGRVAIDRAVYGRDRLDLSLLPEAVIVGRAIRKGDGAPVADALVSVNAVSWTEGDLAVRTAVSGPDGSFRIEGIAAGRRRLTAIADGYASDEGVELTLEAGQTLEGIDLTLSPTYNVSGRVVYAAEGGGTKGAPVANATISAGNDDRAGAAARVITSADGSFTVRGLFPGPVALEVLDHQLVTPKRVTLEERDLDGVVVEVKAMASVSGRVLAGGKPVADADVWAQAAGGQRVAYARSRDGGEYELGGLPPGDLKLTAESLAAGSYARDIPVSVTPFEKKTGVDIEMDLSGSIAGVVVEENGTPVPGVHVRFSLIEGRDFGFATTAADGSFVARALSGGGEYAVDIRPSPRSDVSIPPAAGGLFPDVYVKDGQSHVDGIRLVVKLGKLSIAGVVMSATGQRMPDVKIRATSTDGGRVWFPTWADLATATTDADGEFVFTGLLPGGYALLAVAPGGSRTVSEEIEAGRHDVVIKMPLTGKIVGKLQGFASKPTVTAFPADGNDFGSYGGTVTGDTFTISDLAARHYLVTARATDGAAAATAIVEGGETVSVTLVNRGTGTLQGTVREIRFGAPIAEGRCHLTPAGSFGDPGEGMMGMVGADRDVDLDRSGRFDFGSVPAGTAFLGCMGSVEGGRSFYDNRRVTITAGQPTTIPIQVVAVKNDTDEIRIGIWLAAQDDGIVVSMVEPDSPAARAGVAVGDRLVSVDGIDLTGVTTYAATILIVDRSPADAVDLVVDRGGQRMSFSILGEPRSD